MEITAINTKNSVLTDSSSLDLQRIIEDLFLVLSNKERDVIVKRFSIHDGPRQTLERIGKEFSVTRERVRQIEKIALGKLRRTVKSTKLKLVNDLARAVIDKNGGVMTEAKVIGEVLNTLKSASAVDGHIVRLSLHIDADLERMKRTSEFRPFWRVKEISLQTVRDIIKEALKELNKTREVIAQDKLSATIAADLKDKHPTLKAETIISTLETDHRLKGVQGFFGLMAWRHVNPKSIRDKAYIVLRDKKEPLHFIDIANNITASEFDKKVVTTQAVHNELIRCDLFVLVGRGLYALKEWGYKPGTVAEIISSLLRKKSPLTKQEIIQGVLKQRKVKKGTISLNLQKVPCFVRVGRAVYTLDESKGITA